MARYERLLEVGFLTGSRAFGTARNNSDYDIAYCVADQEKIDEILGDVFTEESNYFKGIIFVDEDKIVNLIPLHPEEVIPWKKTTEIMKLLVPLIETMEPKHKYAMFQSFVGTIKLADRGGIKWQ